VLTKHWPGVPIFDDVCTLTAEDLHESIDIISGGFPCQPFSVAGNQLGKNDDRHLWPQFARLIKEIRPTWVVGENVVGVIDLALDDVLADMETLGYSARAFVIPACAVGAKHRRERVFIVGFNANSSDANRNAFAIRSDIDIGKWSSQENIKVWDKWEHELGAIDDAQRFDTYSGALRVLHGIPKRMDRLKSLGNAVVPQQVYPIFKAIAEIEATA
jgi:DNA (cytosine-5)-methyltransferase 1